MSMEDRLRAHYAERTERESLPDPDTDESLDRLLAGEDPTPQAGTGTGTGTDNVRRLPFRPLALAAAVLAVFVLAGVLITQIEDKDKVSTDEGEDRPDGPVPTTPTTEAETPGPSVPTPSTPDTTAAPPLPASGRTVVVGPYGPLGWWDGTTWRNDTPPVAGGEQYSIIRLDDPITTAAGGWETRCVIADDGGIPSVDVGIREDGDYRTPTAIGVTGVPNPMPRPIRVAGSAQSAYGAAAAEVVASLGITDAEPRIAQVVSGDLDGDGTEEALVVAERLSNPESLIGVAGDYSVVFLRHLVDGKVQSTVVDQSIAEPIGVDDFAMIEVFRLDALVDLNGDGRMEVALQYDYYEGSGTQVYEYRADRTVTQVLSGGCGA